MRECAVNIIVFFEKDLARAFLRLNSTKE